MININEVFGHRVTYLDIEAIAAQACILGGVRTLYLWFEEQFVHLFERDAEEVLNSSRSFRVEFPHVEGSAFARLDSTNQHNLHYHIQIEISLEEISDTALQYWHVLGWTPAQTPADP